jgi:glutamate formiminotransferase/formiminotetrahydrofolate cyclodeaminase
MKIVECVPNFSEGRRQDVIQAIAVPFGRTKDVLLLDVKPDAVHNRTVVTAVGLPEAISQAVFEAVALAKEHIDLRLHQGAHPRMGATDVVPFVPVRGVDIADCVVLARELGKRIGEEIGIPVVLYEAAASAPHRRNLADIRSGEFEGWRDKIMEPGWAPDFGPQVVHESAGVTVIGARMPLIAYNVNLGTRDLSIARRIARKVRESTGGLVNVRALGVPLEERGMAQVSMNLTDHTMTPVYRAYEAVRTEARRYGVPVLESEIIGLIPMRALTDTASFYLQLARFSRRQILETRTGALEARRAAPTGEASASGAGLGFSSMTLKDFTEKLASSAPAPGGGTASSVVVSLAAALVAMVCRLTLGRARFKAYEAEVGEVLSLVSKVQEETLELATADSLAFERVMAALAMPKSTENEQQARAMALTQATLGAAEVPLKVAERGLQVHMAAVSLRGKTNPNTRSDLSVAEHLAVAGTRGAIENVRINAGSVKTPDAAFYISRVEEIEKQVLRW